MAEPYLLEAKIIPGRHYSQNGVDIDAGLSWMYINYQPYDITSSTVVCADYAVCKCRVSDREAEIYPLKIKEIQLSNYDYMVLLFEEVPYKSRDLEIHIGLKFYEA